MKINIQKVKQSAVLPDYQSSGASAVDLHACIDEPLTLTPGKTLVVPTGIAIELPDGCEAQVRGRSGLAAKNSIGLANGIGTIDSDYRGEIGVILINWGDKKFVVEPNMRIAQLAITRFERLEWQEVDKLSSTVRGKKGFGDTGV